MIESRRVNHPWLVALLVLSISASASAQRRDGAEEQVNLEISLTSPTAFGESVLAAGTYRLSLSGERIVFSDSRSMVSKASVVASASKLDPAVKKATVDVKKTKKSVEIRIRYRDREYVVRGRPGKLTEEPKRVDLSASKSGFGVTGGIPDQQTDRELVKGALDRYEKDVKHCGDAAHKQHWTTDHPRFRRCVCPLTAKWRLPKVTKDLRIHRFLAKRRSGYSITVTPAGKAAKCRVWVGSKSPEEQKTAAGANPTSNR